MIETPAESMRRFIDLVESCRTMSSVPFASAPEVIEAGSAFLRPFLANPERNEPHIRLLLEGISTFSAGAMLKPILKLTDNFLFRALQFDQGARWTTATQQFLERLSKAREDLLKSLDPGELTVDLLPPRRQADEATNDFATVTIVLNVALYPRADFQAQSLSLQLRALNDAVQFDEVTPSSRSEAIGTYEVGTEETGKITNTVKEADKLTSKFSAKVAEASFESVKEDSRTVEKGSARKTLESAETVVPLVISSALGRVARWELLQAPRQPLKGGFRFSATAIVPPSLRNLGLDVRVRADLENYGAHEISLQTEAVLPAGQRPPGRGDVQDIA